MESMTDWAFSWPISAQQSRSGWVLLCCAVLCSKGEGEKGHERNTYVDNSLARSARDFDRYYELFGRTWSRG